ncbi:MAG: hypothetical protein LAP87_23570 [Acidobacteriia bacterium]|nr:hypothetical protein [Terriglobia bacterium]
MKLSARSKILLDVLLIFLFTAVLIRPLFKAKYLDKWGSIESTFISDARFLMAHWPHPQWQPLWYGGTRFDYIYPPALRYGTAAIAKVTGFWPVKAYHFYTAFFYCVGIAGVYLLIRVGTRSRFAAWLGAAAAAFMSPSFLFLTPLRHDAWKRIPIRLGVLVKYGEGPHMTALALIPIALAFAWLAFEARRPAALALAGVFGALAVSNNFYGATSLAVFYPILVWSFWITRQERRILAPALAIPAITYGLTAFWLVPSYFQVTAGNMKYVSEHGTTWSIWLAMAVVVAFAIATRWLARGQKEWTWGVFTAGCAVLFSLNVLGNYYFHFLIAGVPSRLAPELDLVYILLAVAVLRWLWNLPGLLPRAVAAAVLVMAFATTAGYVASAWNHFPLYPNYQDRVEYQVPEWLWMNMPDARVVPTGSVRFWFDAWHDLPQLGGGSDQGVLNGEVEQAQWEINLGPKPEPAILWMQCLGTDAAYVSDKSSEEMFKDYLFPHKFEGALPAIYDDHRGNVIYRVPRRWPARARVVETARLNALQRPRFNDDVEYLRAYAGVIEKGPDSPAFLTWQGTDAMRIAAKVEAGQSIVVQENYDPAWHAWSGGKPVAVRKDAMGFMAMDPAPGAQEIALAFLTPFENQVGRVLSAIAILVVIALIALGVRREWRA